MSLKKENEFYLDRINRLQPNTIDLDYLDETFRKVTGFTSENETVIIIE
jgi:cell division protein FtsB